jgi:hypothetical protein
MRSLVLTSCILVGASFLGAHAQESALLDTVTVTASRIDSGDVQTAPAVFRHIRADFVLVEVNCQSASRDPGTRKAELETMFARLKKAVSSTTGYDLFGGELGESSAPISTVLFDDIYADYSGQGHFTLTLSIDTKPDETFDTLMRRTATFLDGVKIEGRAEAYLGDEQFLGARGTDKHRADLISDIRKEASDLEGVFAPASVTVSGLESRVVTQPSGPLELEIFIPYALKVETGSGSGE